MMLLNPGVTAIASWLDLDYTLMGVESYFPVLWGESREWIDLTTKT